MRRQGWDVTLIQFPLSDRLETEDSNNESSLSKSNASVTLKACPDVWSGIEVAVLAQLAGSSTLLPVNSNRDISLFPALPPTTTPKLATAVQPNPTKLLSKKARFPFVRRKRSAKFCTPAATPFILKFYPIRNSWPREQVFMIWKIPTEY